MAVSDAGSRVSEAEELRARGAAARAQARVLVGTARRLCDELEQVAAPVSRAELLRRSPSARLRARLETMPVVEQAKGIIMAQCHCEPAEAFDLLRQASQRSNVPVRELAAAIVSRQTGSSSDQVRGPAATAAVPAPGPHGRRRAHVA